MENDDIKSLYEKIKKIVLSLYTSEYDYGKTYRNGFEMYKEYIIPLKLFEGTFEKGKEYCYAFPDIGWEKLEELHKLGEQEDFLIAYGTTGSQNVNSFIANTMAKVDVNNNQSDVETSVFFINVPLKVLKQMTKPESNKKLIKGSNSKTLKLKK